MSVGYGLTETCGMTTITTYEYWQLGSVGVIGPSCEVRLVGESESWHLLNGTDGDRPTRSGIQAE